MAYDLTLVQVNGTLGGFGKPNTSMGFGTTPFDTLLFSMWTCLPTTVSPHFTCDGGPAYIAFFTFIARDSGTTLSLVTQATSTTLFDGVFNTPVNDVRSHHLLSIDCSTQTVQYYLNDQPISMSSGAGWETTGHFQVQDSINIWDFDIGSSAGNVFPAFADLWCAKTPSFIDLSDPASRRKFINADLTPVYLGTNGSLPFGYQPQIYQTIPSGGVPNDFLTNRGTGATTFTLNSGVTLSFQDEGKCNLPTPTTSEWAITSSLQEPAQGAVGDVWFDNSYVNFDDADTRNQFQNSDGTWKWLGEDGELPTGTSPRDFLTVQTGNPPSDILFGYGQNGGQSSWFLISNGIDPVTNLPYPDMAFDACESPVGNLELTLLSVQMLAPVTDDVITLCWSDDAGASWSNGILKSMGAPGDYFCDPAWYRLGMSRNRIFELSWSSARAEALQGAWVDVTIAQT